MTVDVREKITGESSPLTSVLLFSEAGTKFIDEGGSSSTNSTGRVNSHDYAKGVDISIKDAYIRNGSDNYLPYSIINAVKRSYIQKRAFATITSVAAGAISFINPDGSAVNPTRIEQLKLIYKELGLTVKKFLKPAVCSGYLFGGVPASLSWLSNGREFVLHSIKSRDYKTFRLGKATQKEGEVFHDRHYYHRNWGYREERKNKRIRVSEKKVKSWIEWQKNQEKNHDDVAYMYSYDPDRNLGKEINRTQSYFIRELDGLTDFYPLPSWFSGSAFNYVRADFLLSCFDIDEIENGFHASGYVKVYHKSYKNPESGEAKDTFEKHKKIVEEKLRGAYKSGAITIVPVGIDGNPTNDFMEFVETPSTSGKERHTILDARIRHALLSANGAIYSELFGIRDEKSVLSEGSDKLVVGLKILNQFTVKPLKAMFDDKDGGFLNFINDILGIEERAVILPNLSAFLNIDKDLAKHYLHPDQWFDMYKDFGLQPPTEEQIASGLIPAFNAGKSGTSITVNN